MRYFNLSLLIIIFSIVISLWSSLKIYDWIRYNLIWCIQHGKVYKNFLDQQSGGKIPFSQLRQANTQFGRPHMHITRKLAQFPFIGTILYQIYRFPSVQLLLIGITILEGLRNQSIVLLYMSSSVLLASIFIQTATRVTNRYYLGPYSDPLDDSITWTQTYDRNHSAWIGDLTSRRTFALFIVDTSMILVAFSTIFTGILESNNGSNFTNIIKAILTNIFAFIHVLNHSNQQPIYIVMLALCEIIILLLMLYSIVLLYPNISVRGAWAPNVVLPHPTQGDNEMTIKHNKIFISYTHDSDAHKDWVAELGERLKQDDFDVILDQWELLPGDDLMSFMETAVRDSRFVLIVCTPKFAQKANMRQGGAGWETRLSTGESYVDKNKRKFIPLLREGNDIDAIPSWLKGMIWIDFRADSTFAESYPKLIESLNKIMVLDQSKSSLLS